MIFTSAILNFINNAAPGYIRLFYCVFSFSTWQFTPPEAGSEEKFGATFMVSDLQKFKKPNFVGLEIEKVTISFPNESKLLSFSKKMSKYNKYPYGAILEFSFSSRTRSRLVNIYDVDSVNKTGSQIELL